MKNLPLWLVGASLALPFLAMAQANQETTPHRPGETSEAAAHQRAVAPVLAASGTASTSLYQSSLVGYVRAASPTTSADKAWLPANQFVREVDQMNMGAGDPGPAVAQGTTSALPPSGSASASVSTKPDAGHAHPGMQGMQGMGH